MKQLWQPEHDQALLVAIESGMRSTPEIATMISDRTGRDFSEMGVRRRIDRLRQKGHDVGPIAGVGRRSLMPEIDPDRFWSKADRRGGNEACWPWLGFLDQTSGGYGRFRVGDSMRAAHRVAYELTYGPIPSEAPTTHGLCVLHRCDNPACVNPAHLVLGSQIDNMTDRQTKGRTASGDRSGARRHPELVARGDRNGTRTKPWSRPTALSEKQVIEVIKKLRDGRTVRSLSDEYGVGLNTVARIKQGRTKKWATISEMPQ
jgi:hypothetical protein